MKKKNNNWLKRILVTLILLLLLWLLLGFMKDYTLSMDIIKNNLNYNNEQIHKLEEKLNQLEVHNERLSRIITHQNEVLKELEQVQHKPILQPEIQPIPHISVNEDIHKERSEKLEYIDMPVVGTTTIIIGVMTLIKTLVFRIPVL